MNTGSIEELRVDSRGKFDPFKTKDGVLLNMGLITVLERKFNLNKLIFPKLTALRALRLSNVTWLGHLLNLSEDYTLLNNLRTLQIAKCGNLLIPESICSELLLTELVINQSFSKDGLERCLMCIAPILKLLAITHQSADGGDAYPSLTALERHQDSLIYLWLDIRDSSGNHVPLKYKEPPEGWKETDNQFHFDWRDTIDCLSLVELVVALDDDVLEFLGGGDSVRPLQVQS